MQSNNETTMKPMHIHNPTTQMWRRVISNVTLKDNFFEYFKLVKLAIVVVLKDVENKCTISTITFMKFKLKNI
jgi:hypothetical protein